jgi:hypothetical protein
MHCQPAESDEVKIYIKASSNSTVLIVDLKIITSPNVLGEGIPYRDVELLFEALSSFIFLSRGKAILVSI